MGHFARRTGGVMIPKFRTWLFLSALLVVVASAASADPQRTFPLRDWTLQSACNVKETGEKISTADYQPADWHKVTVPSTVVAGLVADHTLPDPYMGTNILKLPGYVAKYDFSNFDIPSDSPYNCGWWYRTEFTAPAGFA